MEQREQVASIDRIKVTDLATARRQLALCATSQDTLDEIKNGVGTDILDFGRDVVLDMLERTNGDVDSAYRIALNVWSGKVEADLNRAVQEGMSGKALQNYKTYTNNVTQAIRIYCPIHERHTEGKKEGEYVYATQYAITTFSKKFGEWCNAIATAESAAAAKAAGLEDGSITPIGPTMKDEGGTRSWSKDDPLSGLTGEQREVMIDIANRLRSADKADRGTKQVMNHLRQTVTKLDGILSSIGVSLVGAAVEDQQRTGTDG